MHSSMALCLPGLSPSTSQASTSVITTCQVGSPMSMMQTTLERHTSHTLHAHPQSSLYHSVPQADEHKATERFAALSSESWAGSLPAAWAETAPNLAWLDVSSNSLTVRPHIGAHGTEAEPSDCQAHHAKSGGRLAGKRMAAMSNCLLALSAAFRAAKPPTNGSDPVRRRHNMRITYPSFETDS